MSKTPKEYQLHIAAIKEGEHLFQYVLEDCFFKEIGLGFAWAQAHIEVDVFLHKHSDFLELKVVCYGQLLTTCDRCMTERLPLQIWEEFRLVVKQVDPLPSVAEDDEDPFMLYVHKKESFFDLYPLLVDLVLLAIPSVKHCNEEQFSKRLYCDSAVLDKIQNLGDVSACCP